MTSIVRDISGISYKKRILLADVNIPYKLSMDHNKNNIFFCVNADEYSDQSFHSVVLDLESGLSSIIPGIRNGFASAVDHANGNVYLGGSDGIYNYNHSTKDVEKPAIIMNIDIFDMFCKNNWYFVDTAGQNLYMYKNNNKAKVSKVKDHLVNHFVIDGNNDLFFINSTGLFLLPDGGKSVILLDDSEIVFRGATTDAHGVPHFIARDGIYTIHEQSKRLIKILSVDNGYGLAFDKENNIVYSNERSVIKLIPCVNTA